MAKKMKRRKTRSRGIYRYTIRVGSELLRREDGSKVFYTTPKAARSCIDRLLGGPFKGNIKLERRRSPGR